MAMGGDGPWAVAVMWVCTALSFVFVVLRTYTRAVVVRNYGIDDHVFNFAWVSSADPSESQTDLRMSR